MLSYIITDGNFYLHLNKNGCYSIVTSVDSAKKFNSLTTASNILKASVPKALKVYKWKVLKYEEEKEQQKSESLVKEYSSVDKEELKSLLQTLSEKFSTLQNNIEYLSQEQSKVDREISDILHYIEFNKFSACDGYKICKSLKELRLHRRSIKNEIEMIKTIQTHNYNNIAKGNTYNAIAGLENKEYAPREFCDLFKSHNISQLLKDIVEYNENNII